MCIFDSYYNICPQLIYNDIYKLLIFNNNFLKCYFVIVLMNIKISKIYKYLSMY